MANANSLQSSYEFTHYTYVGLLGIDLDYSPVVTQYPT